MPLPGCPVLARNGPPAMSAVWSLLGESGHGGCEGRLPNLTQLGHGPPREIFSPTAGRILASIACRGNRGLGGMSETAAKRSVVLVVEDDSLIRICAVEMIKAEFDVVEAAN